MEEKREDCTAPMIRFPPANVNPELEWSFPILVRLEVTKNGKAQRARTLAGRNTEVHRRRNLSREKN